MVIDNKSWTPPEEFSDDSRVNQLFAPFRSRHLNPHGYDSKLSWWSDTVLNWNRQSKTLKFTQNQLENAFVRKGRSPKCLEKVIQDLKSCGQLITSDEYSNQTEGWLGWGVRVLMSQPVQWAFSFIRTPPPQPQLYIPIKVVEDVCSEVVSVYMELVDAGEAETLVDVNTLFSHTKSVCGTIQNLRFLVSHLERLGHVTIEYIGGDMMIKFKNTAQNESQITEVDRGLVKLRKTIGTMNREIEQMEGEINYLDVKTREQIRNKEKGQAAHTLRKKKVVEKKMSRHVKTLDNLQNMLSQVENAKSDKLVIEAYNTGLKTLKSSGMTIDDADETISNLQEELETAAAVTDAISSPVRPDMQVDDDGLEDELQDLLGEDEEDLELPSVPVTPPATAYQVTPLSPEESQQLEGELDALLNDPSLNAPTSVSTPISKVKVKATS